MDWAYADYNLYNWLGIQAGKMKQAYGLYNQARDVDPARTCILLPNSIYTESYRDTQLAITGISLYGLLPAGFEYTVQFGQYYGDDEGGVAREVASMVQVGPGDVHLDFSEDTLQLHLLWRAPPDGLTIGASLDPNIKYTVETPVMDFEFDQSTWVLSMEYLYNDFTFAAEYMRRDITIESLGALVDEYKGEGYYGMMAYRFCDWFELGSYYSIFYGDIDDRDGERFKERGRPGAQAWCNTFAMTARFDINENWVFKIEGQHMDGMSQVVYSDDDSDEGFLFAAKATFSF